MHRLFYLFYAEAYRVGMNFAVSIVNNFVCGILNLVVRFITINLHVITLDSKQAKLYTRTA